MKPIIIVALDHRVSLEAVLDKNKIAAFKEAMVRILNQTAATGILLDPDYGLEAAKLVKAKELYFCLERSGAKRLELQPDWGIEAAKVKGAVGVKLLWQYREEEAERVKSISADCREQGLKFLLEVFDCPAEKLDSFGADILKLKFPGAKTTTPWVLLSGGVSFEEFTRQLAEAVKNGCRGVAVGRALWQDQLQGPDEAVMTNRIKQLAEMVNQV